MTTCYPSPLLSLRNRLISSIYCTRRPLQLSVLDDTTRGNQYNMVSLLADSPSAARGINSILYLDKRADCAFVSVGLWLNMLISNASD